MSSIEGSMSRLDINAYADVVMEEQQLPSDLTDAACSFVIRYPTTMNEQLNKQELPDDITEEEAQLLDPKYLYDRSDSHQLENPINFSERSLAFQWKHHAYPLVVIRKAYFKLRKEETDIVEVLRDLRSRHILFHLAGRLRGIKDYSVCLGELRASLLQKIPSEVGENLSKQSMGCTIRITKRTPRTHRPTFSPETLGEKYVEGCEKVLKNTYSILLILKEILSTLQVNDQSEVSHKRFVNGNCVNIPFAELMDLVKAGMMQLRTELKLELCSCIKLIHFVCSTFALATEECREGKASEEQRLKLSMELYSEISNSLYCLRPVNVVFRDLLEVIESYKSLLDVSWS